jgi:hypothetical protein
MMMEVSEKVKWSWKLMEAEIEVNGGGSGVECVV